MSRIGLRVEADAAFALRGPGTADKLRRYGFDEVREVVALADRLGYDSVWLPEGFGRDAVTFLTALGLHTERVRLATGILSTYTRTPTMTAMSAATIDELTGGRFVLGLGVGHEPMTEGGHGVPFDRPITRGRETIEIVRRLLAGERVTYEGKVFSTNGAKIDVQPVQNPLPVYLAALKPKMVRLAGEVADGVLLNFSPKAYVEDAVGLVREGEAAAGREPGACDVACYVRVAVTDDFERSKPVLRQILAGRLRLPFYASYFEKLGFEEESRAITAALDRGDEQGAARAVTDRLIRAMVIVGTADECRAGIDGLRAIGLDLPIIAPIRTGGAGESVEDAIEALAPGA